MGKMDWLRSKLKPITPKKGFYKDVGTIGSALGSSVKKGMEWYSAAKEREKANRSNFDKARGIYKKETGNTYPVNDLYTTSETRKKFKEILEKLRNE